MTTSIITKLCIKKRRLMLNTKRLILLITKFGGWHQFFVHCLNAGDGKDHQIMRSDKRTLTKSIKIKFNFEINPKIIYVKDEFKVIL